MTVLVVAGSNRGVTHQVAQAIAESLGTRDIEVTLGENSDLDRVAEFEAIIIGSAAESGKWPAASADLCRRYADALTQQQVWLFSAPVEENSTIRGEVEVPELLAAVAARDHKYFPTSDPDEVMTWTSLIADELEGNS
ncbi:MULTISPECIES: flavodoxin domain-containing protein [unclassified Rhodococcus (in: high G+C Gram-positive bacteria)]|uniref:flavodoxin domain-containing protein n=1 Tax=unclassified Rhodococcus (in: high G+C Gram-positive bacteria) TaxID=192944 RepID=UPI00146CED68|nr:MULTISPECIES: flavodoxin domain-containing protein [unclassified Rhodococcus (in: high G+C Gram-positive bacteria)]NMD95443.1 flavodoxin/nitric oxide synthase [Rhodococcus sp. BL-253-APC-6A1W]NME79438.1 flavodoxin/nitric oxide synthase [Rhodococcus sp. 105337]